MLTLNRPHALNALTPRMLHDIGTTLRRYENDPGVEVVILAGAGDRAFCAGGDIRFVYGCAGADDQRVRDFWAAEFLLDAYLRAYPKTVVTLLDGITMGGGVGLGCHRPVRVVTEHTRLAMPEVHLGFPPDVAATWLLARAPGLVGEHLTLTGERLAAADAIACGLADHVVPSQSRGLLIDRLTTGDVTTAIAELEIPRGRSRLLADREWIDHCYAPGTVEGILARMRTADQPRLSATRTRITAAAPLAVTVALRALREARQMSSMEDVLARDYRLMCRFLETSDLREGIYATAVDKSATPRWSPAALADVTDATVASFFAPLPDHAELSRAGTQLAP